MPLMYHIYQSGAFVWFLWVCEFVLFTSKAIYRNVIWKSEVGIVPAPNIESFLQGPWVVLPDYMLKGLAHTRIKFTLYVVVRVDWDHPTLSSGCTCIKNVKLRKRYMCIYIYTYRRVQQHRAYGLIDRQIDLKYIIWLFIILYMTYIACDSQSKDRKTCWRTFLSWCIIENTNTYSNAIWNECVYLFAHIWICDRMLYASV
jgi:hypothetical protein